MQESEEIRECKHSYTTKKQAQTREQRDIMDVYVTLPIVYLAKDKRPRVQRWRDVHILLEYPPAMVR